MTRPEYQSEFPLAKTRKKTTIVDRGPNSDALFDLTESPDTLVDVAVITRAIGAHAAEITASKDDDGVYLDGKSAAGHDRRDNY